MTRVKRQVIYRDFNLRGGRMTGPLTLDDANAFVVYTLMLNPNFLGIGLSALDVKVDKSKTAKLPAFFTKAYKDRITSKYGRKIHWGVVEKRHWDRFRNPDDVTNIHIYGKYQKQAITLKGINGSRRRKT